MNTWRRSHVCFVVVDVLFFSLTMTLLRRRRRSCYSCPAAPSSARSVSFSSRSCASMLAVRESASIRRDVSPGPPAAPRGDDPRPLCVPPPPATPPCDPPRAPPPPKKAAAAMCTAAAEEGRSEEEGEEGAPKERGARGAAADDVSASM
jgi:hypothetical protein